MALARGLGRRGERVLVLDETRPPHHVGGQLGILMRHSLADAAQQGLLGIAQPAGDGIVLMAAEGGVGALAELAESDLRDLADDWQARAEPPEWLVLNGAEPGPEPGLAATADDRVLVLPGSKSRLADAYALLKSTQAFRTGHAWWILVESQDPAQAEALFASLAETAHRFLGIRPEYLGHLPRGKSGTPIAPLDGQRMDRLAGEQSGSGGEPRVTFAQFWQRMWLHSRMVAEAVHQNNATARVSHASWR